MDSYEVERSKKRLHREKCCIEGCKSTSRNDPSVSFHRFPPSDRLLSVITSRNNGEVNVIPIRDMWIEKVKNDKLSKRSRVCSLHFLSKDFVLSEFSAEFATIRRRLNKYAIPSQNLPTPSQNQQEIVKNSSLLLSQRKFPLQRKTHSVTLGTTRSTSKFKVTPSFEERDVIKCDLSTIFTIVNDIRCGNSDCPEMSLTESFHGDDVMENLEEPEAENVVACMQVATEDVTAHSDVSVQADPRDLATHPKVSVQVDTRNFATEVSL